MNGAINWAEILGTLAALFTVLGAVFAGIYSLSLRMMVRPEIKRESDSIKEWASQEFAACESTDLQFAAIRRELDGLQKRRGGT